MCEIFAPLNKFHRYFPDDFIIDNEVKCSSCGADHTHISHDKISMRYYRVCYDCMFVIGLVNAMRLDRTGRLEWEPVDH